MADLMTPRLELLVAELAGTRDAGTGAGVVTTEADLLRAVCTEPASDEPRLILADWLDDQADARAEPLPCPRAEFIRCQVGLARHYPHHAENGHDDADCGGCILRRRVRELLLTHGERWLFPPLIWRPVKPQIGWRFRRGFVEVVTLDAASWLVHGDALREATPLREVRLTTWPEIMRRRSSSSVGGYLACFSARLRQVERVERVECWYGIEYPDAHILPHLLAAEWPGLTFHLPS